MQKTVPVAPPSDSDLAQLNLQNIATLPDEHPRTVRRWMDSGTLLFRKVGRRRFTSRTDVVALLHSPPEGGAR